MRKNTRIGLILATLLCTLGAILFFITMSANGWDFSKLSTVKYETNEYLIQEPVTDFSIDIDTADILFAPSLDGQSKVVCFEEEKEKHAVAVENGTLTITAKNEKEWHDYIGINFHSAKITVYLADTVYQNLTINVSTGDVVISENFAFENIDVQTSTGEVESKADVCNLLKIETNTGDIRVENASVGALNISVSTGEIRVNSVNCQGNAEIKVSTGTTKLSKLSSQNLTSNGSTGDITLTHVITSETMSVVRSTGDVKFEQCDAKTLNIQTSTGDVTGSFLTEKIFVTQTDTGRINVPNSTTGDVCTVNTDTGDIRLEIRP